MPTPSILEILKKDHKEVKGLLESAIATTGRAAAKRSTLFAKINADLSLHSHFEEEQLYPALLAKKSTKEGALEAYQEHIQLKFWLNDIAACDPADERWKAKVTVLLEDIRHHVEEEEQKGGLFDELKALMSREELVAFGEQYAELKAVG